MGSRSQGCRIRDLDRPPDATRQFRADPRFLAAADLLWEFGELRLQRRFVAATTFAVTHARALYRSVRVLRSLPLVDARVSEGAGIGAQLKRRTLGIRRPRFAVSVLPLPSHIDDYLRGPQRQSVRRNVRRARACRVTCRGVHDDTERRARAADISEHRGDPPPFHTELLAALDTGVGECFVAIGDDDTTLVFALVTVDMVWAHLAWFLSLPDDERASSARYQLTLFIIRALIERRLEYLFADSALTLTPGLRYFQERLGFEPMNVRVWEGRSALTPGGQLPEAVAVR